MEDKMKGHISRYFFLLLILLVSHSCILDEYKFSELTMKEDWGMKVSAPLFQGDFRFVDLIHDETDVTILPIHKSVHLKYPSGNILTIPENLIFDPASVIDSFSFLINGNYALDKVDLGFEVENGSPFPINIQLRFYTGPPATNSAYILPKAFPGVDKAWIGDSICRSTDRVSLNDEQMVSLSEGDKLELTTWFDPNHGGQVPDTLLTDYPVKFTIILHGILKGKNID